MNTLLPLKLTENTPPTLKGALGNAWLIDMDAAMRRRGQIDDPRAAVTLPTWIASAAYAHPVWSHYAILCVALRDVPGVPTAVLAIEGATHEVMVYALAPDRKPAVDEIPHMLQPANFVGQFIAPDDQAAAARVQQAVQDVIDGTLNPDTDHRRAWVARFSDSNLKPGALDPDYIAAAPGGGLVAVGTGAAMARTLDQIATTAAACALTKASRNDGQA